MFEGIKNFFRVGGLIYRITDAIDDMLVRMKLRKKIKDDQDDAIARAKSARKRVSDSERNRRD